jgi:Ca2+-binding EF-hand superfamily protein
MNRSIKFALAAVTALGVAVVAVPVIAEQSKPQHGGTMGQGMGQGAGMMGGHDGMMGGGMGMMGGMMGGAQSYAMATFDANKDGILSPEEMTAGINAELKTYDTDGNGTLSLDEFALMHAAHMRPMTVRAFQMHDADGDAQVTEAELAAMAAMMQSQMGDHQKQRPGMGQGMMDNN